MGNSKQHSTGTAINSGTMETQQTSEATLPSTNADQSTGLRQQHGGEFIRQAVVFHFNLDLNYEHGRKSLNNYMATWNAGTPLQDKQQVMRLSELLQATHKAAIEQAREECADYVEGLARIYPQCTMELRQTAQGIRRNAMQHTQTP